MSFPVDSDIFQKACEYALTKNVDFFDFRADISRGLVLEATEGRINKISSPLEQGFGCRALVKGAWGFAVTSTLELDAMKKAFDDAITLARLASEKVKETFQITPQKTHIASIDLGIKEESDNATSEKIAKVLDINLKSKARDQRIRNVGTIYRDHTTTRWVGNSFGTLIRMDTPTFRFYNIVYAREGSVLQEAFKVEGFIGNWTQVQNWDEYVSEPVEDAVRLLSARPAPGGTFTVIMDPKLTGTFTHEAFGHASEADSVVAKASILEGKIGEQLAAPSVSIVDDATNKTTFGYYPYDDEGTPGQRTRIIDKGTLVGYITDLESASRLNLPPTGNGRVQNSQYLPQVRMSSTILLPGDYTEEELVQEVKQGILAIDWLYGYTDPVKGEFQFKTRGGYLIENGEKKDLIRDVALSGLTLEALKNITGLSKEIKYSPGGTCGKGGQQVRVGDGSPFTCIKDVKVGGLE